MRLSLLAFLAAGAAAPVTATDTSSAQDALTAWEADPTQVFDAADIDLEVFRWIARPIVVFADTPADPRFREQLELLGERPGELTERDVIVIVDSAPAERSEVRKKLRPRGFMMALIGKDGGVKLRKPFPWDIRELSRSIDKMPMRQEEVRARREGLE